MTKDELHAELHNIQYGCGEEGYEPSIHRILDLIWAVIEALPEKKGKK